MRHSMIEMFSVAGVVALFIIGVTGVMAFMGKDVPQFLVAAVGAVVGYFFGKGSNQPPTPPMS